MKEIVDSYDRFLTKFNINKDELYQFGISETILPPIDLVAKRWDELKNRIYNNGTVRIRGYGRDAKGTDLYIGLYRYLFENTNVKKDSSNNAEPQKIISQLTGYKRNTDLFNYQVSHIFGKTKNLFLFEAPWNIAFVPKLIDPFTGHETKGVWPKEYQKLFLEYASGIYGKFIEEYNQIISRDVIIEGISAYIDTLKSQDSISRDILLQFEKDVRNELSVIDVYGNNDNKVQATNIPPTDISIGNIIEKKEESQDVYNILLRLKHEYKRSWVQLRNGCLDLIGVSVVFTTQPIKNTSRAFARKVQNVTGLSFEELLQILDEKKLGIK